MGLIECTTGLISVSLAGAEGMQSGAGEADWGGAIGRTPDEIADHAVALYSDQERWNRAQLVRENHRTAD
jgi:hypothetical protein